MIFAPPAHGGGVGYQTQRSLRLRASASASASRANSGSLTQQKVTFSFWEKSGTLGTNQCIFSGGAIGGAYGDYFRFNTSNQLEFIYDDGVNGIGPYATAALFRDPTAPAHIQIAFDTTQPVQADRCKVWRNNQQLTVSNGLALNALLYFGYANSSFIGRRTLASDNHLDGLLSEFYVVYGQALAPSAFCEYDSVVTTYWKPKSPAAVRAAVASGGGARNGFGANGFYLPFSDPTSLTTLMYDRSQSDTDTTGNNWTASGISLTAGATYDSTLDVPLGGGGQERGNYCTLNSLTRSQFATISDGNLKISWADNASAFRAANLGTLAIPPTGKWYFEALVAYDGNNGIGIGVCDPGSVTTAGGNTNPSFSRFYSSTANANVYGYSNEAGTTNNNANVASGQRLQIAIDMDSGKFWAAINNVWQGGGDPVVGTSPGFSDLLSSGKSWMPYFGGYEFSGTSTTVQANFGQRPFSFSPPTGFKALHTGNLPTPTGAALEPKKHFDVVTAAGANIKTTTEALFPGDFAEWIKDRANANNWQQIDTVRGASAVLQSNTTAAETTYTAPSGSSVGFAWKAGGAAVTNNAGSISSQVSANVAAGFSIVTYTGTGANATVGHGLGVAPKMVIVKSRTAGGSSNWATYHASNAATGTVWLNVTNAFQTTGLPWNNTAPTSGVFSIGATNDDTNTSTRNFVAYCFAEIPGFSKFGSIAMNASADGAYLDLGFSAGLLMLKRTDSTSNWILIDTVRQTYNVMGPELYPNLSSAESIVTELDFTAGGVKFRNAALTGTWIYAAWSRAPFKYSNAR